MTRRTFALSDDRRLFNSLLELYALADVSTYPRRVIASLGELFPARFITYNELHRDASRNRYVWWPPHTQPRRDWPLAKAFERHVGEHPLIRHYARSDDHRVLAISDFLSRSAYHRLKLYEEFYRKVGVEYQLAVTLRVAHGVVIGIALSRKERDFTARERRLLQLLRPHLVQAYENALLASRMKRKRLRDGGRRGTPPVLSPRQMEVLGWVAGGKTNREIGKLLAVSPRTVQKHLELAYEALGVETRTGAVMRAIELSLPITPLAK